jgi:VanZ family protein
MLHYLDKLLPKIKYIALLIYWAMLSFLLFKSHPEKDVSFMVFEGIDKVAHASTFLGLAFLFKINYPRLKNLYFYQIMLIYAILTEIIQGLLNNGRAQDINDIAADMLGVILGHGLFTLCKTWLSQRFDFA